MPGHRLPSRGHLSLRRRGRAPRPGYRRFCFVLGIRRPRNARRTQRHPLRDRQGHLRADPRPQPFVPRLRLPRIRRGLRGRRHHQGRPGHEQGPDARPVFSQEGSRYPRQPGKPDQTDRQIEREIYIYIGLPPLYLDEGGGMLKLSRWQCVDI